MSDSVAFTPATTIECRELDAEMVLFNRESGRIFVLNETAAFVWQGLKEGLACEGIAEELSQQTGIESGRVLADCQSLIEQWTAAGLAAGSSDTVERAAAGKAELASVAERSARHDASAVANDAAALRAARRQAEERRQYRIADLELTLDGPAEAFRLIDGLLDHLALPSEAAGGAARGPADDEHATLTVARTGGGWTLFVEDVRFGACSDDTKLAPMIHAAVLHLSYAASESLVSIHGAAVFSGEDCILFPGQPGAGKSTLTAALVDAGFGYCTDDFVLLDGKPLRLRGIPLCIGLKEGAWPLLANSIPTVASLPTRLREDGQLVRYLAPPQERIAGPDDRFRAAAIVFPRVASNEPCRLDLLSRSTALLRIADAGYHLLGELDVAAFEAMLTWLRSLDCYQLSYSSLDEAVAAVSGLLEPDKATIAPG